jgi:hypothetical protein
LFDGYLNTRNKKEATSAPSLIHFAKLPVLVPLHANAMSESLLSSLGDSTRGLTEGNVLHNFENEYKRKSKIDPRYSALETEYK